MNYIYLTYINNNIKLYYFITILDNVCKNKMNKYFLIFTVQLLKFFYS